MKILNQYSYDYKAHKGEYNKSPSKTDPTQGTSIKNLIQRYKNGIPFEVSNYMHYDDVDSDSPNPLLRPDADLSDLDSITRTMEKVNAHKKEVKKLIDEKEEEKRIKFLVDQQLKKEQKNNDAQNKAEQEA